MASFTVIALSDADGDGIPDDWETQYGLDPGSSADRNLDSDGDGQSNYAEYLAGTWTLSLGASPTWVQETPLSSPTGRKAMAPTLILPDMALCATHRHGRLGRADHG